MQFDSEAQFLDELIAALAEVQGIKATVLGGSRAKGTHHPGSDFDVGLYYDSATPPDLNHLRQLAKKIDDRKEENLLTDFGEWGPWINGGGWLKVKSYPVDILYRDLAKVRSVFQDCLNGQISIFYQPGHPHGFVNSVYFAEVACSKVLYDKDGLISELKKETLTYPVPLKKGTLEKFLWESAFSLQISKKGIPYQDVSYITGGFFRAVSCLNQVLFALNEHYWMNEKGAVRTVSRLPLCPKNFERRINQVFSRLEPSRKSLNNGLKILTELVQETAELVER